MTSIPFSSIIEGDRGRSQKNYGNLDGLISSLRSVGSIHPITLSKRLQNIDPQKAVDLGDKWLLTNNKLVFDLVAGGRRHAAMKQMEITELFHSSVLDPSKLGFVFADEVPEDVLREAELDENLHRLDVGWIDNCLMICNVHELKKAKKLRWGAAQTAAMLGQGYGATKVSYAVGIGPLLRAGDKELLECVSFSAAISVMVKRGEDAALAELQRRSIAKLGQGGSIVKIELGPQVMGVTSFMDTLNTSLGPKIDFTKGEVITIIGEPSVTKSGAMAQAKSLLENVPLVTPITSLPLSQMYRLGDCFTHMSTFPDSSFDHIVTDIPYGIDMDNLSVKGKADIVEQHDVEANKEQMPAFLEQAFRLVKPRGFCVFFMDLDHWNFLQLTAKLIGWKVQDWPLVWIKTHNCQNQGAAYNFTKTYECAMVLRRDSETVLRKQRPNAHWMGDGAAERKLYNNPFAKPFLLWKELIYDNIAFPSQSIYDPFAGECSGLRAAVNCGLVPFGSEISDIHFNRGIDNLKSVYALLHQSNIAFT